MTFEEFCLKHSYFYSNTVLKIALFVDPSLGKPANNNYNRYFKDGHTFEKWLMFMNDTKLYNESTYHLVLYLPLTATVTLLLGVCLLIRIYI